MQRRDELIPSNQAYLDRLSAEHSPDYVDHVLDRMRLTAESVVPRLERWGVDVGAVRLADLGCGDGGASIVFAKRGAKVVGIDVNEDFIQPAVLTRKAFGADVDFRVIDATSELDLDLKSSFDLILLQEVVEHVSSVEAILRSALQLARPGGYCYASFPPYPSPAGGHHHYARKPYRYIPWLHLAIPRNWLIRTLPKNHRNPHYADEIRTLNKLTIGRFERTLKKVGWHIREREAFLIRPSIAKRLGLPVVKGDLVAKLPLVRDLFITGIEYLLEKPSADSMS